MPTYALICQNCNHQFEKTQGINEEMRFTCSQCNSGDVSQDYSQTVPFLQDKSPKTLGTYAEQNTKKLGKEQCDKLYKKHRKTKKSAFDTRKLPKATEESWWRSDTDLSKIKNLDKYIETGTTI